MTRRWTAFGAGACVLLTVAMAHAQAHEGFGRRGQFILSADRLFPLFSYTHVSQDAFTPPPGDNKQVNNYNQTAISLLWGSNAPAQDTFFSVPRLGVDYVIVPNVTVGGDIVVFFTLGGSTSTDTTTNGGVTTTASAGNPSAFVFGVAPRGGYILALTDLFSLWLRGGFSYYVASTKTTNDTTQVTNSNSTNQLALDLDPQFVITPFPHLGFTLGLTADIPLTGRHSATQDRPNSSSSTDAPSSVLFFGVTGGLLGYF